MVFLSHRLSPHSVEVLHACVGPLSLLLLFPRTVPAEYLGDLSENELNPHSIFTDVGAYGALSPTSPRNSIGL